VSSGESNDGELLRKGRCLAAGDSGYRPVMDEPVDVTAEPSGDAVPGDPAPGFSATASTGKTLTLDDFVGKVPIALTFVGTLPDDVADELVQRFNDSFAEFGRHHQQVLIVTPQETSTIRRRRQTGIRVPLLADDDGTLLARFAGSATFPATVVIDRDGFVSRVIEGGSPDDHIAAVLDLAREAGHQGGET
jgi:peroxiredoxin